MSDQFQEAFNFKPLDRFSLKQRIAIRVGGFVFASMIRLIGRTLRFETVNEEYLEEIKTSGHKPINVFWHDRIVSGTYFFRDQNILVLSSASFDSEYTARCIQRFGFGVIKGSSTRGGIQALVGMIRAMRAGYSTAFTLDGPKGPRYVAKAGPVLLAKKTGSPMLPFVLQPKKFWVINSWDRLQIPKPFARVAVFFGRPIYVPAKARDEELDLKRLELQASLDDLVARSDEWQLIK